MIYASTSLGEAGLSDIFEEAAGRDDVLVVFRGMKPGQKLQQFVREIHALVRRFEEDRQPHVIIDPNRFRHANVTAAPTLTLEENGKVLAKVQGITGIQWLQSKTDGKLWNDGKSGNGNDATSVSDNKKGSLGIRMVNGFRKVAITVKTMPCVCLIAGHHANSQRTIKNWTLEPKAQ